MPNEIWKVIDDHPNYMISNQGRVLNIKRGRYLKTRVPKCGYHFVILNGKYKTVHVMVAQAFIPNPDNKPEVNHIDENKDHNYQSNLEWMTSQENSEYSNAKTFTLTSPSGERVEIFNLNKFAKENNLNVGNLHSVFTGRVKQHKGWTR